MNLSDRLKYIADEIKVGETMADIGTDHGFLPIYLRESGKCPRVILSDVSEDSLNKARNNCRTKARGEYDFRLGSGMQVLDYGEVDVVVIAGMGGILMTEILGENLEKSRSVKRYILQPRNHPEKLRKWLADHSFVIEREGMVREGKFICEILTVSSARGGLQPEERSEEEYLFPHSLIEWRNPLTEEYLRRKLFVEERKLEEIKKHSSNPDVDALGISNRIKCITKLLKELEKFMKVTEITGIIERFCPVELSEDWDNPGYQLKCGDADVDTILVALEVTDEVIDEAIEENAKLIITHHPLIFSPIKRIDTEDAVGAYLERLIGAGISVYSCHTNFDKMEGGNNDYFGKALGFAEIEKFSEECGDDGFCRKGHVPFDLTLYEMAARLSEVIELPESNLRMVGKANAPISTVGWCTGAGSEFIQTAMDEGCDLFITGDIKYHDAQLAKEKGICLIDAGHFGTEKIFGENMAEILRNRLPENIDVIESSAILNPFVQL